MYISTNLLGMYVVFFQWCHDGGGGEGPIVRDVCGVGMSLVTGIFVHIANKLNIWDLHKSNIIRFLNMRHCLVYLLEEGGMAPPLLWKYRFITQVNSYESLVF
jgi:hypothetical protein